MGQSRRPHERVAHDQLSSLLLRQPLESATGSQEKRGVIPLWAIPLWVIRLCAGQRGARCPRH